MTAPIRPTTAPARPLSVRNVRIRYPDADAPAPADVSFDVAPGEVVLLLGPSGCGKSTLSLAFNGLIPHALPAEIDGAIDVGGIRTAASTVAQLSTQVAMVFQDPDAQLVTGSVLDEVAFGPENLRLPVDEVLRRAEDALRRVGLWERREHNPERLSGGGRQRLAIACALAMAAPLLVLDEPTANLDPAGIEDVYDALTDIVADGDRAIVLVEHNLDQAIGLIDRVVVLDAAGRVVADGDVDAVLRARADALHALGVWLPASALAALRLRAAGYALDPLPLTPAELRGALEATPMPQATAPVPEGRTSAPQEDSSTLGALAPREDPHPEPERGPGQPRPHEGALEPLIRVRGLTVSRRRHEILHGIDLDVRAGEFLAIVGANGAGKTTLAQAIAGVVPPPRGRVSVGGADPARVDVAALARTVGFVFQNPEHQFVTHTVFDELAQGLRLRRTPEDEVRERVADMLERFGLTGREQSHPFLLSGGQKRRLSVGTALIAGAPIIVLDEPTFGQDRARADELLIMLRDLNERGTTVIVVTHDMQLVTEYATHVAVLAGGELLAHAPTPQVFADTELVARAGLRTPPLAAAFRQLPSHPALEGLVRLRDLPTREDAA
ncbi:ATP-binding cassette domain-containing protein [Microbacterium sp. LRZ72]|uniref:ABC transporter ATP-binding protein n=1 Tax=Microbacterium sp. LRZ72 TaxID=2942481 RepID=UPI0029A5518B|nr:ATP-binding cassette domain-containing protein [Microbacterium sp. LRZ72]MDX2377483.1 ATP-binding cassette domain-containing protein [Microbacterium sp. LRZ72]